MARSVDDIRASSELAPASTNSKRLARDAAAWDWWARIGQPQTWLAPMVGLSEPAFRMLCRSHGCGICSTEMIDAAGYARSSRYRAQYPFAPEDRPLVVQLGGSNPADLAAAAAFAAPHCDGVELNVGCPQRCARRGGYGAFLMDNPDLLVRCVKAMAQAVSLANPQCACCVKIRCFDDTAATVALAQQLQDAGAQCITVHGRTRDGGGGKRTGKWPANWDWIRAVKHAVGVPVVSNGNIRAYGDITRCLDHTGADCVMSGCGALKRPFIFSPPAPPPDASGDSGGKGSHGEWERRLEAALEYLAQAAQYDAHPRQITKHLQEVVPKGVSRRDFSARLLRLMTALAAGSSNHAQGWELAGLDKELRHVLHEVRAGAERGGPSGTLADMLADDASSSDG